MMRDMYLTACSSSSIVKPLFYNRPETGDIIFDDNNSLQDYLSKTALLSDEEDTFFVNEDGLKIKLNL